MERNLSVDLNLKSNILNFKTIETQFLGVLHKTIKQLEAFELDQAFNSDKWQASDTGNGITNVLSNGKYIEKAAVNFSSVKRKMNPSLKSILKIDAKSFEVCGVSSIIHPVNPFVPIIHMNIRYFLFNTGQYWFGGGIDLTPHYIDTQEAVEFHIKLKTHCDQYNPLYYTEFKQKADEYFQILHRNESRGIGGIFFDRLCENKTISIENLFNFVVETGNLYGDIYSSILKQKGNHPYGTEEKNWQEIRRSRYVEFNLLYDQGTQFGLKSNGKIESIFCSMPPTSKWVYNYLPEPSSKEYKTLSLLHKKTDWINYGKE